MASLEHHQGSLQSKAGEQENNSEISLKGFFQPALQAPLALLSFSMVKLFRPGMFRSSVSGIVLSIAIATPLQQETPPARN